MTLNSLITRILFILMLSVVSKTSSQAQSSDFGNWLIYFGNKQINPKLNLHHEVQYRNYNAIGDMEQLLLRTGLGYNLTEKNNNILLGYGFIASNNYVGNAVESVNEHRIYQQFITKQKIGRVAMQHRYRYEQRFIEGNGSPRQRVRYFVNVNIPITKRKLEDNTLYFSAYNEIFIGHEWSFDRNRLYSGVGFRFNNSLKCEAGYMNQIFGPGFGRDQFNLILFASF